MANYFTTKVRFKASPKSVFEAATQSTFFKGFKLSLIDGENFEMTDDFPWPNKTDFESVKADIERELKMKGWELADSQVLGEAAIVFVPIQIGMSQAEEVAQCTYAV